MCIFTYRCRGLILLETYTSNRTEKFELPPFLEILREVTGDVDYSMYNLSKKLDPPPSIPSTPHDDPIKDSLDAANIDQSSLSELAAEGGGGYVNSTSPSSVSDCLTDRLEMLAKDKVASELNTISDAAVHDSMEVRPPEVIVKPMTSETNTKVVVDGMPGSIKNGYHSDADLDTIASLTLSKLGAAHGNALLNGSRSENGHVVLGDVDDYERFAKLCLSGKSGAPVVK